VKAEGIQYIQQNGPFQLRGDAKLLQPLDELLAAFVAQGRMKLPGGHYEPCYRLSEFSEV